jgi:hypothetical protein
MPDTDVTTDTSCLIALSDFRIAPSIVAELLRQSGEQ